MNTKNNAAPIFFAVAVLLVFAIILTGCGGSSESTPVAQTTTQATPPPAKVYSAFDPGILTETEDEMREQMRDIARNNPGDQESLVIRCVPDTDRTFTCTSATTLSFDDGMGGKLCTDIEGTAKGQVDPKIGVSDWTMVDTDTDDEPGPCAD